MAEEIKKKKTRMYDPWGYQEENNYQSSETQFEIDLNELFASAAYNDNDKKIHFFNNDGKELSGSTIDTTQFASASVIEEAYYDADTKELVIKFSNGDEVRINMAEIVDENEFGDGLQVDGGGVVSVKVDGTSDPYITVSADGIKISGIKDAIDAEIARATEAEEALDDKINAEESRAISAETALNEKIEQEITDRIADVDAEETRAKEAEQVLTTNLANEITRATQTEQSLNHRIDTLNDELDAEKSIRESNDAALNLRITTESNDRVAAINAEKTRAEAAETNLNLKIEAESERAIQREIELDERIDEIISGAPIEQLYELIEKLGYNDNDTLQRTNEHEVAFGEYNVSNTSEDTSGQTIFSIGNGTDDDNRSNAIEVRKNGDVYLWIEGEFMNINKIIGQIAHEVYDTGTTHNSNFFDGD